MDSKDLFQLYDEAILAKNAGDFELAYSKMSIYLENVDRSFTHEHRRFLAEIDFKMGRLQSALKHCNDAILIMSDFIPALELRSSIYISLGDQKSAESDKRKIQMINEEEQKKWDDPNHYYHYK